MTDVSKSIEATGHVEDPAGGHRVAGAQREPRVWGLVARMPFPVAAWVASHSPPGPALGRS